MQFDVITLIPDTLNSYFGASILGRAQKKRVVSILTHNLRRWAGNKHNKVDDAPYGGGPGMVIRVDVVHRALKAIYKKKNSSTRVILLTPGGKTFDQRHARRLSKYKRIILIAGRYEAIDARVGRYVDEKISIGNFVLTGGELAAACVVDAVARLVPGVVGKQESLEDESFSRASRGRSYIEYPQYTRPAEYNGVSVPKILQSGNHELIRRWRERRRRMVKLT